MFEGSVDQVTTTKATGWLYDRAEGRTADVVAVLHSQIIGSAESNQHRPDLEQVGFGNGVCGFEIIFNTHISDIDQNYVTIHPVQSNLIIPRTNDETYRDFVIKAIQYASGAGRNRTLLGGLWTDRTDALSILSGRIRVGTCPTQVKDPLRSFIADGFVQLDRDDSARAQALDPRTQSDILYSSRSDGTIDIPQEVLSAIAPVLRAVFDDNPVLYKINGFEPPIDSFHQVCSSFQLSSPAECACVYFVLDDSKIQLDYIFESHELPEFGPQAISRWSPNGRINLPIIAQGQQARVCSQVVDAQTCIVVGPGLIHKIDAAFNDTRLVRAIFGPQRSTPMQFLEDGATWREYDLGFGIRARL